jgi:nitrate reductase NapE component
MPQTRERQDPVLLAFIGICLFSVVSILNVLLHEPQWWVLLPFRLLHADILVPLIGPAVMAFEYLLYRVLGAMEVTGFGDNSPTEHCIFLAMPVLPMLAVTLTAAHNIREGSRQDPDDRRPFLQRAPIGDRYRGSLWVDLLAIVASIISSFPWALFVIGWRVL